MGLYSNGNLKPNFFAVIVLKSINFLVNAQYTETFSTVKISN